MNRAYWDKVAEHYDATILDALRSDRKGVIRECIEAHADAVGLAADYGCGIGNTIRLLGNSFLMVDAFDISERNIELARHKCRNVLNVRYHHRDLSRNDALPSRAHFAVCINVLLTPDPETRAGILRTLARGMLPGGRLIVVVPSIESALYCDFRLLEWNLREGFDYEEAKKEGLATTSCNAGALANGLVMLDGVQTKHYLREELEAVLRGAGFNTLDITKVEYPWSTEFEDAPRWLRDPYPWDWMALAEKT